MVVGFFLLLTPSRTTPEYDERWSSPACDDERWQPVMMKDGRRPTSSYERWPPVMMIMNIDLN
ncbi:hypothetical protein Hanom_Chr09g00837491 [Helianthus anomalus]